MTDCVQNKGTNSVKSALHRVCTVVFDVGFYVAVVFTMATPSERRLSPISVPAVSPTDPKVCFSTATLLYCVVHKKNGFICPKTHWEKWICCHDFIIGINILPALLCSSKWRQSWEEYCFIGSKFLLLAVACSQMSLFSSRIHSSGLFMPVRMILPSTMVWHHNALTENKFTCWDWQLTSFQSFQTTHRLWRILHH